MAEIIDMLCLITRPKKPKEMTLGSSVSGFSIFGRYCGSYRRVRQHLQVKLTENISHSHYQFRTILDQRKRPNTGTAIDTAWHCKDITPLITGIARGDQSTTVLRRLRHHH